MKYLTFLFILLTALPALASDKKSIALFELDAQGVSKQEALAFTDRIRDELFKTGQYTVMERTVMDKILSEQGFQKSGAVSSEVVVEAGKLLGVQMIIVGSVSKVGSMYTISLRSVDVSSGTVTNVATVDYDGSIEGAAKTSCPQVVTKLVGEPAEKKGSHTWLYIGGGILIAGGAAAVLLSSKGDDEAAPNAQGNIAVTIPLIP